MLIQKEKLQVGEILATSWGWEQTNWNFYQIVKVSEKSIWIREICSESKAINTRTYETKAIKDMFKDDKVIRKTIKNYMSIDNFKNLKHHDINRVVLETIDY